VLGSAGSADQCHAASLRTALPSPGAEITATRGRNYGNPADAREGAAA
jgi:hypothetical protein